MTGVGGYRHVVADLSSGRVSAITVVEEGGAKVLLDLSAQIVDRAIARIEAMMVRDTEGARRYEQVALPPPAFSEAVDSSQRVSRQAPGRRGGPLLRRDESGCHGSEGRATVSHSIVRALPFGSRPGWVTPAPATSHDGVAMKAGNRVTLIARESG